jgi:hypothetical protein
MVEGTRLPARPFVEQPNRCQGNGSLKDDLIYTASNPVYPKHCLERLQPVSAISDKNKAASNRRTDEIGA